MIDQALACSFLFDLLARTAQDVYRMALYTSDADLNESTPKYTTQGEVVGQGYGAGGQVLQNLSVRLEAGVAFLDWDDPVWPNSSIAARGALIYNASRGNVAVAVLDLGQNFVSTNGSFVVLLPEPTPQTALISLGGTYA